VADPATDDPGVWAAEAEAGVLGPKLLFPRSEIEIKGVDFGAERGGNGDPGSFPDRGAGESVEACEPLEGVGVMLVVLVVLGEVLLLLLLLFVAGSDDGLVATVVSLARSVVADAEPDEDVLVVGVGRGAGCGGVGVVEESSEAAAANPPSSSKRLLFVLAAAGVEETEETDPIEDIAEAEPPLSELELFSFDLDFFGFF
jgi:hypothetical protein